MCTCASCSHTDSFAGWRPERARDGSLIPDMTKGGFDRWPRGNVSGARGSAHDYALHVSHCGAMSKPIKLGGPFPQTFAGYRGPMPIQQNALAVLWNAGRKMPDAAQTAPARPRAPAKAPEHLPELDRQPEPARIYTMKDHKAKTIGRPPIAKGGAIRKLVTLDPDTISKAKKLGAGKLSAGLREAVRRVKAG